MPSSWRHNRDFYFQNAGIKKMFVRCLFSTEFLVLHSLICLFGIMNFGRHCTYSLTVCSILCIAALGKFVEQSVLFGAAHWAWAISWQLEGGVHQMCWPLTVRPLMSVCLALPCLPCKEIINFCADLAVFPPPIFSIPRRLYSSTALNDSDRNGCAFLLF